MSAPTVPRARSFPRKVLPALLGGIALLATVEAAAFIGQDTFLQFMGQVESVDGTDLTVRLWDDSSRTVELGRIACHDLDLPVVEALIEWRLLGRAVLVEADALGGAWEQARAQERMRWGLVVEVPEAWLHLDGAAEEERMAIVWETSDLLHEAGTDFYAEGSASLPGGASINAELVRSGLRERRDARPPRG